MNYQEVKKLHMTMVDTEKLIMSTFISTRSSSMRFEDLSNDIMYEIFDYLDMYYIYEAFSDLNIRFQNLICSTLPPNNNTLFLSKSNYQRYYKQFILPNVDRIRFVHLWNPLITDLFSASQNNIEKFIGLKTLILDNASHYFLHHLTALSKLSSLIIRKFRRQLDECIDISLVMRLPALKYYKISSNGCIEFDRASIPAGKSSLIEHLIINTKFNFDKFYDVLLNVPHLRRLSIDYLFRDSNLTFKKLPKLLNKLTHISLKIKDISFPDLEPFIIDISHHLQVF